MSSTSDAPETPRHRTDWGRVADGVFLAGLGVFFLLATSRGLPDGFWLDAVSFWPVLLISAGIRIVFEKTVLAAGMVLGPLVVLGTLFWLAWGTPPTPGPPGEWQAVSATAPEGTTRARIRGHLAGAQVNLDSRSLPDATLVEGRAASREADPEIRVDEGERQATARLEGRRGGFMMLGTRREVWELGVSESMPFEIDFNGAFLRAQADLRTGHVLYAEAAGAFNSFSLSLPRPNVPVNVHFKAAFSALDVTVPEGTRVHVRGAHFPLNYLDRGPAQDGQSDEEPGYNVIVDGAFTVVHVQEGPPPEGGWPPLPPVAPPLPEDSDESDDSAASEETLEEEATPPAEDPTGEDTEAPPAEDPNG